MRSRCKSWSWPNHPAPTRENISPRQTSSLGPLDLPASPNRNCYLRRLCFAIALVGPAPASTGELGRLLSRGFETPIRTRVRPAQRRAFLVLPRCPLSIYLTSDFFRWPIIRGHMRTRLDHVGVGQTPSSPSLPPLFSANATLVRASGRVSDVTLLCARMSAEVHVSQRRRILTPSASLLTSTTSSSSTSQSVVVRTGI